MNFMLHRFDLIFYGLYVMDSMLYRLQVIGFNIVWIVCDKFIISCDGFSICIVIL